MPEVHSKIGGSRAKRILNCPWSLANVDLIEPPEAGFAAAEGTALHKLLEMFYLGEIESIRGALGMTIEGVTLDGDQIERAVIAALAFDAYCDQLEEEIGAECEIMFEAQVKFDGELEGAFGTCDILIKCGYLMAVMDWKFGRIWVPAGDNAQLLFYGQAARKTFPDIFGDCTQVEMSVIQPAADPVCDTWASAPERLEIFEKELIQAVRESKQDDPPAREGSHCNWCHLEAHCPAKQKLAKRALKASAKKIDIESLSFWLENRKAVENFLTAVYNQSMTLLEAGIPVEGYKLVHRRANRKWVDPELGIAFAVENGIDEGEYMVNELRTPPQIEKLVTGKIPDDLVEQIPSGNTLAPRSDKRRDLNANDFQALKDLGAKK